MSGRSERAGGWGGRRVSVRGDALPPDNDGAEVPGGETLVNGAACAKEHEASRSAIVVRRWWIRCIFPSVKRPGSAVQEPSVHRVSCALTLAADRCLSQGGQSPRIGAHSNCVSDSEVEEAPPSDLCRRLV